MMIKILARLKAGYINSVTYRSEIFLWLFLETIPVLVTLLVWISIYQTKTDIVGYSLSDIINYYTIVLIITGITTSHFEPYRAEQIRLGKIDYFLTRPFSFLQEILLGHIASKLFYLTLSLPFFMLLLTGLTQIFSLQLPSFSLQSFSVFLGLILFAGIVEFLSGLLIVLLTFWFEGSEGLEHFKQIIITLFSGWLIPLEMMPQWLRQITEYLPLKYMYATPIRVALYHETVVLRDWLIMIGFVISLLGIALFLWKHAKLAYTSAGG